MGLDNTSDQKHGSGIVFAQIDASASGANLVVAADPDRKIKVLSYVIVVDGQVSVRWMSGTTPISGAMALATNGGIVAHPVAPSQGHWLETKVNEALNLSLGAALGARGHLTYFLEP